MCEEHVLPSHCHSQVKNPDPFGINEVCEDTLEA